MEIELRIEGHHCHSVGHAEFKHPDTGIVTIKGHKCHGCNKEMLDAEDYCNILEHEIVEVLCQQILWYPHMKWSGYAFNRLIRGYIGDWVAWHTHGNLLYSLDYG